MTFKQFYITPVPQGYIQGGGEDEVGPFEIMGSFNNNATAVRFAKKYKGKYTHTIYYEGEFTGSAIEGFWSFDINSNKEGGFKIWME
jgi:hypothetical protein